jgi:outer membrane receptor protein involved in Fe transport
MNRRLPAFSAVTLLHFGSVFADGKDSPPSQTQEAATSASTTTMGSSQDLDEVVVHGIRRGDLILPTTVSSSSAYGLDLGVMDTPRNNTLLSEAQLDALNVDNAGGFSYLTSSSYSDSSFGQPNVPRIRGQYADVFYNGMRESFTDNGYGAPMSFNSFDSIDIVKGPASVQAGPGAGVGGSINVATKVPSLTKTFADFSLEVDSQQKRKASVDASTPIGNDYGLRVSFLEDDSGSYYTNVFFHQQALFVSMLGQVTPKYSVMASVGFENTTYRENDGINRVNQQLIDNGTYLTGGPVGGAAAISNYGTEIDLTGTGTLSPHADIDEPAGNGAHAMHVKAQLIQTFNATDDFTLVNNTFYDYMNRYNQVMDYYADSAMGAFTIENKTDAKYKFEWGSLKNDMDAGITFRYAHVPSIQNYANEPVSVYDLSGNPNAAVFPSSLQSQGDAVLYSGAYGHQEYGVPGRDAAGINGSVISNLKDFAAFLEHQVKFTPQWSFLYGVRGDVVQLNYCDPLGGSAPLNGYAQCASTSWYGLYNGNSSLVYQPVSQVSLYLTYNKAQYVLGNANDGAVAVWGEDPTAQLRQNTLLEEGGIKLDLLDQRLFVSAAGFYQERSEPIGAGGSQHTLAHIHGAEAELNFQPNPHFFATASYSYLHTTLDTPNGPYNFPAQAGINYDGAGYEAVYLPGQTFQDPGVPKQLFNLLANYKNAAGWGVQANLQVTSPIDVVQSGYLDVAATAAGYPGVAPAFLDQLKANGGYFQSPVIPWQYTVNAAAFYSWRNYTVKFSVYNLTDRRNLTNENPFFGDDFITVQPPRDFDLTIKGRF